MHHHHNHSLVILSIIISIFASYTALDLVNSLSNSRGKVKWVWLSGGSLAMGVGIWSMHFIGMLAFRIPGIDIYYDFPLLFLSVAVAILASALALFLISHRQASLKTYIMGSLVMGTAIAGMHYIGIASMRMAALIHWNMSLVVISILIAIGASFAALYMAFKLRHDLSLKGFFNRGVGGVFMGIAISGMHYTAMAAMSFTLNNETSWSDQHLLATDGLAAAIIIGTLLILGIALSGSNIDRALTKRAVMNDVLQEGIKARDQFLSIASHELKTPLTALKLQTEFILRQISQGKLNIEQAKGMLKKTTNNFNRINCLVDEMLDISRISLGKLILHKTQADLKNVVEEVVETFRPQFEHSGVHDLVLQAETVVGQFDVFRIEQVLNNLISNALKYGNTKGVEVSLRREGNYALITVRDQGIGIPEKSLPLVFNRFERINGNSTISGLGLGLYIAKEIVQEHEGDIWAESDLGKGSSFYVRLPLDNPTA